MWEKIKEDGSRKLKNNAIPTIFSFTVNESKRRKLCEDQVASTSASTSVDVLVEKDIKDISHDHDYIASPSLTELSESSAMENSLCQTILRSGTETSNMEDSSLISSFEQSGSQIQQSTDETSTSDDPSAIFQKLSRKKQLFLYSHVLAKKKALLRKFKNKLRYSNKKIKSLKKEIEEIRSNDGNILRKIFSEDQILALKKKTDKKSTKLMKWSNKTIIKALKLKFQCGMSGYEELLRQGLPYPSVRTLQRKLQNLNFDSGILSEVFDFLKVKMDTLGTMERDCMLVLDEMAIRPSTTYDTSLKKMFGTVTLPNHTGTATHVLVFMLAGITSRWKQIVAYYFTSNTVDGSVFKDIINEIFKKTSELGVNILSITSDMGACNQALWRTLGIMAGRHRTIKNSVENPLDSKKKVFFIADVPHLFKNVKAMLVTNKIIRLPISIQEKYNLPTDVIRVEHILDLIKYQEELNFKLVPKLTEEDLFPSHYDKMKVSKSTSIINHDVSSALKFIAEHKNRPDYLTTAWFIDQMEKWFYLMTSRSLMNALSKIDVSIYTSTIKFLEDFMEIINFMEVGLKKLWKPSQTGILISTRSILDIQKILLEEKKYKFILTGRFSQDCLENVFSVLRSKQIVPNALQVKNNLKILCVSQYLKVPKETSYENDDRELYADFLNILEQKSDNHYDAVKLPATVPCAETLNYSELNSLYNIAGYIVNSVKKQCVTCDFCINSAGSTKPLVRSFTKFTNLKCYKMNTLFFCHETVFYFFVEMELLFRRFFGIVSSQNIDLRSFFVEKMKALDTSVINSCHRLSNKIISRFVTFRLKISSKKMREKTSVYASRSLRY